MAGSTTRGVGIVFACLVAAAVAASALAANVNTVKITVAPKTGKLGTHYNIVVHGTATTKYAELALSMTISSGKCPTDYVKGFASLAGVANSAGAPIGPKYVHGNLKQTVHAKITNGQLGTYGICAYLTLGPKTLAHASSSFTVTN